MGVLQGLVSKREIRIESLDNFRYLACFKAASAYLHRTDRTLILASNFFDIRVPPASGLVIGVTDVVPEEGPFVTNITSFGHSYVLLFKIDCFMSLEMLAYGGFKGK